MKPYHVRLIEWVMAERDKVADKAPYNLALVGIDSAVTQEIWNRARKAILVTK